MWSRRFWSVKSRDSERPRVSYQDLALNALAKARRLVTGPLRELVTVVRFPWPPAELLCSEMTTVLVIAGSRKAPR